MTVEKMAERKKNRELLEKIFGSPKKRTWQRPKQVKPTNTRKDMGVSDNILQACIAEYSTGRFKIKKGEIVCTINKPKKGEKTRTRRGMPWIYLTVVHRPTGVSTRVYIEPGMYSRSQLRKLREKQVVELMPFLERIAKRYLKACMARQFGPIPKGEYDEK
jgi:hypothetical protein